MRTLAVSTVLPATVLALLAGTLVGTAPAEAAVGLTRVWSVQLPGTTVRESSVLATDLDGDGQQDVVVGGYDARVRGLDGVDGSVLPGWPVAVNRGVNSSPAAGDVDGDGRPEVVVGSGRAVAEDQVGALNRIEHDGRLAWSFAARDVVSCPSDYPSCYFASPPVHSTPALGDISRDGSADISFGTLGLTSLWSVRADGTARPGFPFYSDDTIFSSPALHDVDGDGTTDMIIGTDSTPGPPVDHQGGVLRAMRGDGSQIWEFRADEIFRSSPAVGDVDGDGRPEVVVGTGDFYSARGAGRDATKVFVLDMQGRLERTIETHGNTSAAPALADVSGDGRLDVVIGTGTRNSPVDGGRVQAYDGATGVRVLNTFAGAVREDIVGGVSTADLDGDGRQDVLAATGSGVYVRSGRDGSLLAQLNVGKVSYQNTPTVTDVDSDGRLDILLAGTTPAGTAVVERYELSGTQGRTGATSWPTFRHDARRTGSATPPPLTQQAPDHCATAAGQGYWMTARDGGVFAYCGASFFGSTGALRLNAPVVGMAATPTGSGYWLLGQDGGIFSYGDAVFRGSTGAMRLNAPVVGMAPTPSGSGYWLLGQDGGIFSYGDAVFRGSTGALRLNAPVVGMAPTPGGGGYWLLARDGGIFAFGDARFLGSTGATRLNSPVVGMAATPSGKGYWLVSGDGGIFTFGDAGFHGSSGSAPGAGPVVGIESAPDGKGYWTVGADGSVRAYGSARYLGAPTGALAQPVVGLVARS
ncbi:FG-GAP repeat domain-containing protein [Aquipuribacter hungaricus]|uniref:FG-GAP repeat domain-containing protein n=1 Tax=Aquipuribacter hungaricus TaxID=545624 RepID=A0ABV7WKU1_9MICO